MRHQYYSTAVLVFEISGAARVLSEVLGELGSKNNS